MTSTVWNEITYPNFNGCTESSFRIANISPRTRELKYNYFNIIGLAQYIYIYNLVALNYQNCVVMACHFSAPRQYRRQCWLIVNWTSGNKFQYDLHQSTTILILKYDFEYIVCKMTAILSRPQCINHASNHKHTETHSVCLINCPNGSLKISRHIHTLHL